MPPNDDALQDAHNQGQEDSSKGEYDTPHSITPLDNVIYSKETVDKMQEENKAYDDGWRHTHDQKK